MSTHIYVKKKGFPRCQLRSEQVFRQEKAELARLQTKLGKIL